MTFTLNLPDTEETVKQKLVKQTKKKHPVWAVTLSADALFFSGDLSQVVLSEYQGRSGPDNNICFYVLL